MTISHDKKVKQQPGEGDAPATQDVPDLLELALVSSSPGRSTLDVNEEGEVVEEPSPHRENPFGRPVPGGIGEVLRTKFRDAERSKSKPRD